MLSVAVGRDLGDDRDDLRRADVEADDQVLCFLHHRIAILPLPCTRPSGRCLPGRFVRGIPARARRSRCDSAGRRARSGCPRARARRACGRGRRRSARGAPPARRGRARSAAGPRRRGVASCQPPRGDSAMRCDRERQRRRALATTRDSARRRRADAPVGAGELRQLAVVGRRRTPRLAALTSAASFQRASGACSSTVTSSRCGHCRRSATLRTQGTRRSDARARSRFIVKNVPASSSRMTASRCARAGALQRAADDDLAEGERRLAHEPRDRRPTPEGRAASSASAQRQRVQLARVIPHGRPAGSRRTGRRTSSPPRVAAIGTSEWPVMPGDVLTSRKRKRAVGPQDEVEPAPAAAADDVERRERGVADLPLLRLRQAARAVSTSSRRRSTCCGSRSCPAAPRCGSAAARGRRRSTPSARRRRRTPRPAPAASCCAAAAYAVASSSSSTAATLVMPIVEPSRAGFTISGSPSSATTRIQSVRASTTR